VPGSIAIPARFNGPLESGNGGYCSGAFAGFLGGSAEVSLRAPVPLETPLAVERDGDEALRVLDGKTLIAEASAAPELEVEVPESVSPEEAHRAAERYRGLPDGPFSRCFVCGRAREDALGVFAGEVEGRELVASPWTPPAWAAGESGQVRPELVWAVLDCPTFFAAYLGEQLPISFLVRLGARIDAPVLAGEEHVVIAWPSGGDGRKRHAGSAVLSGDGEVLAAAHALMVEPRD
jgi:hypothetical protein